MKCTQSARKSSTQRRRKHLAAIPTSEQAQKLNKHPEPHTVRGSPREDRSETTTSLNYRTATGITRGSTIVQKTNNSKTKKLICRSDGKGQQQLRQISVLCALMMEKANLVAEPAFQPVNTKLAPICQFLLHSGTNVVRKVENVNWRHLDNLFATYEVVFLCETHERLPTLFNTFSHHSNVEFNVFPNN